MKNKLNKQISKTSKTNKQKKQTNTKQFTALMKRLTRMERFTSTKQCIKVPSQSTYAYLYFYAFSSNSDIRNFYLNSICYFAKP